MGEGSLNEKVISVLYKVFGDSLYFEFTLSSNSEVENKTARFIFNDDDKSFEFEAEIDENEEEDDEVFYLDCVRCGNSYPMNEECACLEIYTKIVEPPLKFKNEIEKIRSICKEMEAKDIAYLDWDEYFISKGYKATLNTELEISLNKLKILITNKNNTLPLEINFIQGKFAGWLSKK
jgi:hypothetical protein